MKPCLRSSAAVAAALACALATGACSGSTGDLECRTARIQDPEARAAFERLLDASPEIEAAR